jgi:hypothetical protein
VNRALVLVVALYAVWRVSVALGRRRERAVQASFPSSAGRLEVQRCARCGLIAPRAEMTVTGFWPVRSWVCPGECSPGVPGERASAPR